MAKSNIERVVIVGCGIAGPVLGMFLKRVGIEPVVCERRSREALDEGAFVGVAPNGMSVLAELGLRRAVEAIGVPWSWLQVPECAGSDHRDHRSDGRCGTIRDALADGPSC
jgi:2-polyprenyl-6-methoxyphenol hydroxylase-like FAD-dependent oxidoreductase